MSNLDPDFILGLGAKNLGDTADLTLGEYLAQYNQLNNKIQEEQQTTKATRSSNIEKLVSLLENLEDDAVTEELEMDEANTQASKKTLFVGDKIDRKTNKNLFTTKGKVRQSPQTRTSNYSNTKVNLTDESKLSPLKLKQFQSN